jgi:hypothetical protein
VEGEGYTSKICVSIARRAPSERIEALPGNLPRTQPSQHFVSQNHQRSLLIEASLFHLRVTFTTSLCAADSGSLAVYLGQNRDLVSDDNPCGDTGNGRTHLDILISPRDIFTTWAANRCVRASTDE